MTHWRTAFLVAAAIFPLIGGARAQSLEKQPAKPLPRVLLIGDSIRGGYGKGVQQLLAGKAEVSMNDKNAQYTGWGLKKIDEWLGDGKWDIIHFNWGLWDMYGWEYFNEDRSPAKYEERLELLVSRMKKTGAKLIWATTTPVCPEPEKGMRDRFDKQVRISPSIEKDYQDAALRVMKKHQVAVNDLHALMLPDLEKFQLGPDNVHFNEAGCEKLAQQVAKVILQQLDSWHTRPNIILILADDLGYGDVSCYNAQSKIQTPNIDRLAKQGLRFTDAHSPTAVCTPTRYALLTGRYSWRTRLARGVLNAYDQPLIADDRLTLPSLLKTHGYHTACIGKWHLGWDWRVAADQRALFAPERKDSTELTDAHRAAWSDYFSKPIAGGPTTRGFDFYFGTDVPNIPPYGFIQNDRFIAPPVTMKAGDISGIGNKTTTGAAGPMVEGWRFDHIMPGLMTEAESYLAQRSADKTPFFLYLPLTAPHFPVVPSETFLGKSGVGELGDFIIETDAGVGRIVAALDRLGLAENTLLIITSDNGPGDISRTPLRTAGHDGSGGLRGHKTSVYEGGHRVPFIARWPGHTPTGKTCDEAITHACLMATMAEIFGDTLPANAAEDSFSILPLLNGRAPDATKPTHPVIIHDSGASVFAVRQGQWKLVLRPDGGSELYDLAADRAEKTNRAEAKPILVKQLTALAQKSITQGRTAPGERQKNDRIVPLRNPQSPLNE